MHFSANELIAKILRLQTERENLVYLLSRSISHRSARFTSILARHLLNSKQLEVLGLHIRPAPAMSPLVDFLKALISISTDVFDQAIEYL